MLGANLVGVNDRAVVALDCKGTCVGSDGKLAGRTTLRDAPDEIMSRSSGKPVGPGRTAWEWGWCSVGVDGGFRWTQGRRGKREVGMRWVRALDCAVLEVG